MRSYALPPEMVRRVLAVHGELGAAWLRALPRRIGSLMHEWRLDAVGAPFAGARPALVAPARGPDGAELVLKIHPAAEWAAHEADALVHWGGIGAARLVTANEELGALLIERVVPGNSLAGLSRSDDRAATAAAAAVIVKLRAARRAAPASLPDIASWTAELRPQPGELSRVLRAASDRAAALAAELRAGAARSVLHGDLQHFNVLESGDDAWLAIDPKGLTGPREAEAAALLRNPRAFVLSHTAPMRLLADRVAVLAEQLGDDRRLMVCWAYVLAVLAAVWAAEDEEGERDVDRWLAIAELIGQLPEQP